MFRNVEEFKHTLRTKKKKEVKIHIQSACMFLQLKMWENHINYVFPVGVDSSDISRDN